MHGRKFVGIQPIGSRLRRKLTRRVHPLPGHLVLIQSWSNQIGFSSVGLVLGGRARGLAGQGVYAFHHVLAKVDSPSLTFNQAINHSSHEITQTSIPRKGPSFNNPLFLIRIAIV